MTVDGSDRSFGAPRFDVVLRGYDRRQVDEHISRLQRVLARMRTDLDTARSQVAAGLPGVPPVPPGARPRPTPRPRPDGLPMTEQHDVVGTFTDRMHAILQAAEEEAGEIRGRAQAAARAEEERLKQARSAARTEEETVRTGLTELLRQRDAVLADLTRVRGQLEAILSGPTARITVPRQDNGPSAAARREAGAGQPLPGTPPAPEAEAASAGERPAVQRPVEALRPGSPVRSGGQAPSAPRGSTVGAPTSVQSTGELFRSPSGGRPGTSGPVRPALAGTGSPASGADPSGAPTSGPSTSGASTSGASTSGASTSGASTSGASTSGSSTSGSPTSGASTSGSSAAGPEAPGPAAGREPAARPPAAEETAVERTTVAPVVGPAPVGSPAEQTAVVAPAQRPADTDTDTEADPDADAARTGDGREKGPEATQLVEAVRPAPPDAEPAAVEQEPADDGDPEATQIRPASASRSG